MSNPSRLLHTLHASAWALLVLSAPLAQAQQATRPLNDTGIDWCADVSQNNLDCPVQGYEGQDGDHGRDALARKGQLQKIGGGAAGFDFTKLPVKVGFFGCCKIPQMCYNKSVRETETT